MSKSLETVKSKQAQNACEFVKTKVKAVLQEANIWTISEDNRYVLNDLVVLDSNPRAKGMGNTRGHQDWHTDAADTPGQHVDLELEEVPLSIIIPLGSTEDKDSIEGASDLNVPNGTSGSGHADAQDYDRSWCLEVY